MADTFDPADIGAVKVGAAPDDKGFNPADIGAVKVGAAPGSPEPTGDPEDQETSWYKNIISKLGGVDIPGGWLHQGIGTRFMEGVNGFEDTQLSDIIKEGSAGWVGKDVTLGNAIKAATVDLVYHAARGLDAIRSIQEGIIRGAGGDLAEEMLMDPGVDASLGGVGGILEAASTGIHTAIGISDLAKVKAEAKRLGKLKVTGGPGDVPNIDRAVDAKIVTPQPTKAPEPVLTTPKEMVDANFANPSTPYPSTVHYDVAVPSVEKVPVLKRVSDAYDKLSGGQAGTVVRLSDLRKELPDVPRAELDAGLGAITQGETNGAMAVMRQDDPRQLKPADQEAAYNPKGEPFHLIIKNPGRSMSFLSDVSGSGPTMGIPDWLRGVAGTVVKPEAVAGADKARVHLDPDTMLPANEQVMSMPSRARFGARKVAQEVLGDPQAAMTMTGREFYEAVADKLGPQEASARLAANGVHGLIADEGHVVFDSRSVEPLNVNGQPVPPPPAKAPPAPPQRVVDGAATDAKGNIRSDVWKGVNSSADVRGLVDRINKENGGFEKARAGEMPAEHVAAISDLTGIPARELSDDGISIKFNNDSKLRAGMQALQDTAHQWHKAATDAVGLNDTKSLIGYQEQELLHQVIQEYTTGKLAEAGRTLAVPQEFYGPTQQRPMLKEPAKPKPAAKGAEGAPAEPEKPTFDKNAGLKDLREKVKTQEDLEAFATARGDSVENIRARARKVADLNPDTIGGKNAVVAEGQRLKRANAIQDRPWWEKLYRESLLSGPFTHARYLAAGVVRNYLSATVSPVFNATVHAVEAAFGKQFEPGERVRFGESLARLGTGHVEAFEAMLREMETGKHQLLPGEVEKIGPDGMPMPDAWPAGGPFSAASAGIHTYHGWLAYAMELKARAYRSGIEAGLAPGTGAFEAHSAGFIQRPTPEAIKAGIESAKNMANTTSLGDVLGPVSAGLRQSPIGFLLWTFNHIPVVIAKKGMEYAPGLQLLNRNLYPDLLGRNGELRRASAIGKLAVGQATMATAANLVLGGNLVGGGPIDPEQRAAWLLEHPMPYAFRAGGKWVSYEGWGPVSIALGWSADMAEAGYSLHSAMTDASLTDADKQARQKELGEAAWQVGHGVGHILDEAGLRQLVDISHVIAGDPNDNASHGQQLLNGIVGSVVPTFGAQIAAAGDPFQRQVNGVVDAIRNRTQSLSLGPFSIPLTSSPRWSIGPWDIWHGRDTLPIKYDRLGAPVMNAKAGITGGILPTLEQNKDIVNRELFRLGIAPTRMPHTVNGITLSPEQWTNYQNAFGLGAHDILEKRMSQPDWASMDRRSQEMTIDMAMKVSNGLAKLRLNLDNGGELMGRQLQDLAEKVGSGKVRPDLYPRE